MSGQSTEELVRAIEALPVSERLRLLERVLHDLTSLTSEPQRADSSLWADGTASDLRTGTLADAWVSFVPKVRDLRSQSREFLDSCRRGPTAEPAGATNFPVSCTYRVVRTGQTQTLTLTKAPHTFNGGGDAKSREVALRH